MWTLSHISWCGLGALGWDSFHLNERGLLFLILLSWNKSWNKGFLFINRPTRVGSTNDETKRGLSWPWSFSQFFLAHISWNRASLSLSTGFAKILTMYSSIALFNSSGEWDVSNLLESLNPRLRVVFFFSYFFFPLLRQIALKDFKWNDSRLRRETFSCWLKVFTP